MILTTRVVVLMVVGLYSAVANGALTIEIIGAGGHEVSYFRSPVPEYPLAARQAGEQGQVMLRVLVTPKGAPGKVTVEKSSGFVHLDAAAVEAVRGWKFLPAKHGEEAVEAWILVPIVFRLEGGK